MNSATACSPIATQRATSSRWIARARPARRPASDPAARISSIAHARLTAVGREARSASAAVSRSSPVLLQPARTPWPPPRRSTAHRARRARGSQRPPRQPTGNRARRSRPAGGAGRGGRPGRARGARPPLGRGRAGSGSLVPRGEVALLLLAEPIDGDSERRELEPRDLPVDLLGARRRRAARGSRRSRLRTRRTAPGWRSSCPSQQQGGLRPQRGSRGGRRRSRYRRRPSASSNSSTIGRGSRVATASRLSAAISISTLKWPVFARIAPSFMRPKCSLRMTCLPPVAVTKMSPTSAARSIDSTSSPSMTASSARIGSTSVTMTCAPMPRARDATPRPHQP